MEKHQVSVYVPVTKNYSVIRYNMKGGKYNGDCSGLAWWFYTNIDPNTDDIVIHIHGDFHITYLNKEHLSVSYENKGIQSQKYHMSLDMYGNFYAQPLTGIGIGMMKKSKKKKSTKKKKKKNKKKSS